MDIFGIFCIFACIFCPQLAPGSKQLIALKWTDNKNRVHENIKNGALFGIYKNAITWKTNTYNEARGANGGGMNTSCIGLFR